MTKRPDDEAEEWEGEQSLEWEAYGRDMAAMKRPLKETAFLVGVGVGSAAFIILAGLLAYWTGIWGG